MRWTFLCLVALVLVTHNASAQAAKWGTIKGRVVLDAKPGTAIDPGIVVDARTQGVRWVMVWLTSGKAEAKLPIHPALARFGALPELHVANDAFHPRVLGVREGQALLVKNKSDATQNIASSGPGLAFNFTLEPKGERKVEDWKAPSISSLANHLIPKMRGYVRVFDHPYFAVTNENGDFEIKNAPAGAFRIIVWQESIGWVVREGERSGKEGIAVEIQGDGVTDLGSIKLRLS